MSEIPNSAEGANQVGNGDVAQQGGQTNSSEATGSYMLYIDPMTQQWSIHPYYVNIFMNQLNII
jgi:hypothetical protein